MKRLLTIMFCLIMALALSGAVFAGGQQEGMEKADRKSVV